MKVNRHGQAKILSTQDITRLFENGLTTDHHRVLFAVCFFTGCRIAESCSLLTADVYGANGSVRPRLTLRKSNTKGKLKTRSIPVRPELLALLETHQPKAGKRYLFPGRWGRGHIHPDSASAILREAFEGLGIEGASTHSFRRTALTRLSNAGVPLRVIQEISGHETLSALQKYLEVTEQQVVDAIATLKF
jgi:integrase/recombinase XerD